MATNWNRWTTRIVVIALVVVSAAGYSQLEAGSLRLDDTRPPLQSEPAWGVDLQAGSAPQLGHKPQTEPRPDPQQAEPDAPPAAPAEGPIASDASDSTGNAVRFVYFVEADREPDPSAVANIERQALDLQAFWYEQFGGTFSLTEQVVDVINGDHVASWYDETPNGDDPRWYRLMNIRREVREKLGVEPDEDVRIVGYPSARIDGRVGANRYTDAWMDGDDVTCIDGSVQTTPYSADYPANCLSTVAHELGHVYGLGHQGDEDDCMQFGFYLYVNDTGECSFSPENRQAVISDPINEGWLDAEPGDRVPESTQS